jgi:hypothetical protein
MLVRIVAWDSEIRVIQITLSCQVTAEMEGNRHHNAVAKQKFNCGLRWQSTRRELISELRLLT